MAPEMAAEAMRAYGEPAQPRTPRQRRGSSLGASEDPRTLEQMLSAIEEGGHTRGTTERMRELEAREDVLKGLLAQEPANIPDIHPNVSGIYQKRVERLTEALNTPRIAMRRTIRALVEKITLRPVRTAAKLTPPYMANWARFSAGSKQKPLKKLENAKLPQLSLRECRYRWLRGQDLNL